MSKNIFLHSVILPRTSNLLMMDVVDFYGCGAFRTKVKDQLIVSFFYRVVGVTFSMESKVSVDFP